MPLWPKFAVGQMAMGGARLQIRALGVRRHRSLCRWGEFENR